MDLRILCAGAAQALVQSLRDGFRARTGAEIVATFGAVGALREKLDAGGPCDAVVLTALMIADLKPTGRVLPGTTAPLGRVRTGVAVRDGDPLPGIADRAQLVATLVAASTIYVPDIVRSTAGIHVASVLRRLGIYDAVAWRLSVHPNGATAMRALAEAEARGAVGCTQITEIRYTTGVALVGPLPTEFELATVYSVAVCTEARDIELARYFAGLLSGPATKDQRSNAGFE